MIITQYFAFMKIKKKKVKYDTNRHKFQIPSDNTDQDIFLHMGQRVYQYKATSNHLNKINICHQMMYLSNFDILDDKL